MMRTNRLVRLGWSLAAVALTTILIGPESPADAADPSRDSIFEQLRVDAIPADYVILVDTSQSMSGGGLYGGVRATLGAFLAGLARTDYVAVYTFDDQPALRYTGSAARPDRIVETLPKAPTPHGQTDIGAAIDQALKELERDGAATVASVVLITDGIHDPPSASRYPKAGGPAWDALAQRATRLRQAPQGYALSLRGKNGAARLGTVLPGTQVLDPTSIGELRQYLDRAKDAARLQKARLALAPDIGKGVTATWRVPPVAETSSGPVPITLTLRSDTAYVPLTVSDLSVAVPAGLALDGQVPQSVELQPGQSVAIELAIRSLRRPWVIPFRDSERSEVPLPVSGSVTSPWAGPLRPGIDLKIPPVPVGSVQRMTVHSVVGTPAAQYATAGSAVLLLLLVMIVVYRVRRLPQSGTLLITSTEADQLGSIRLRGRTTRVRGRGIPVRGRVVARRVAPDFTNRDGAEYTLRYRDGARWRRSVVASGAAVLVQGVLIERIP